MSIETIMQLVTYAEWIALGIYFLVKVRRLTKRMNKALDELEADLARSSQEMEDLRNGYR